LKRGRTEGGTEETEGRDNGRTEAKGKARAERGKGGRTNRRKGGRKDEQEKGREEGRTGEREGGRTEGREEGRNVLGNLRVLVRAHLDEGNEQIFDDILNSLEVRPGGGREGQDPHVFVRPADLLDDFDVRVIARGPVRFVDHQAGDLAGVDVAAGDVTSDGLGTPVRTGACKKCRYSKNECSKIY
jgi:hypothetical protein